MKVILKELYKVTVTEYDFGQRIIEEIFYDTQEEADEYAVSINRMPRRPDSFFVADVLKIK